jgi:hypothetical protein
MHGGSLSTHGWTPETHPCADDPRAPPRERDPVLAAAQIAALAVDEAVLLAAWNQ